MKRKALRGWDRRQEGAAGHPISEWAATISVLVVTAFLVTVAVPQGWYAAAAPPGALPADAAAAPTGAAAAPTGAAATAAIEVMPEETQSPYVRAWRIRVSERATGRPAGGVQVSLFADHVQMPGAHPQGPLPMQPTGTPGEFRTEVGPIMPGTWAVEVTVTGAVAGREQWRETVGPGGER